MARNHTLRFEPLIAVVVLLFGWTCAREGALAADKPEFKVSHTPKQPKSGEIVTIKVTPRTSVKSDELKLQYQMVEPGSYIALDDPAYAKNWRDVPLEVSSDRSKDGQPTLHATLPGDLHKNRRLIRYRVFSVNSNSVVAPLKDDTEPNHAYFVYDGIPEWRAAINPKGTGNEAEMVTFGTDVMRSIQAYHLIAQRKAIENATWRQPMGLGHPERHEYKHTGTLVADGKVYDHVRFRARGGTWRHAMGKNMWKIDLNKGHHFEGRDNYGRKYETKWGKLNLGACIQQGDYGMRGEQGMFEALAYRLFNLVGVEAPHTHWIQLRIVDGADESPANQYLGDFWGLYLATEEVDDDFLKEHGLPEGNLYKMDFGEAKAEHLVKDAPADASDVREFENRVRQRPDASWWRSNVDLPRYYSYRAIVECIHHYDIGGGKNYFYYHNPKARRWQVIPWDVDLTWADHMYGNGAEPFYRSGLLQTDPAKGEYERRLAEIRDLLFNPDQAGALLDEYAALISDPKGGLSIVDADRAKWDYHPIMSSEFSVRGKADPGRFYRQSPTRDFRGMVQLMKRYVEDRGKWVDGNLLIDAPFVSAPTIALGKNFDFSAPKLQVRLADSRKDSGVEWRLAEVSNPNDADAGKRPGRYEINAIWQTTAGASVEIPTRFFDVGRSYRIRARTIDSKGSVSRWSAPLQLTRSK
jgi:hypothetical protein